MHPSELDTWIERLPTEAKELRVKGGLTTRQLAGIGSIDASSGGLADAVRDLVARADLGPAFRVFVHGDRGKVLDTASFSPTTDEPDPLGAIEAAPISSTEDALWRLAVVMERSLQTITRAHVETMRANAEPLRAIASLFQGESERRREAEKHFRELFAEHVELRALADQAADQLAQGAGESEGDGPLQAAVAKVFERLAEQGLGAAKPSDGA